MSQELISFLVHVAPGLIVGVFLILAVLLGFLRGFRKSLILFIQAAGLAVILLVVFLIFTNKSSADGKLFSLVSKILGEGSIQNMLGVSADNQTFTDCFIEFIPKQMNYNEGISLILKENGAYLLTLASTAAKMVIAFAFWIIYLLAVFLMYIVYQIFYPVRRYIKKKKKAYENAEASHKAEFEERQALRMKEKEEAKSKAEEERLAKENEEKENKEFDDFLSSIPDKDAPKEEMPEEGFSYELDAEGNLILPSAPEASEEPADKVEPENDTKEGLAEEVKEEAPSESEEAKEEVKDDEPQEVYEPLPPYHYRKRRILGAVIGGVRNLIAGLIFLSFIGSFFYIIAGGTGSEKMEEMDWGNEEYNLAYNAYSEIESYGSSGIFKVLNAFHDTNNVPFYLFAADLVFQGNLSIPEDDINENVYLRKEMSLYTGFAKNTLNLLLKYGKNDIKACMNGEVENEQMMDVILRIMQKDEFKTEFNKLIDDFDASTYFISLSYSMVTSIVNHIEELGLEESMGTDNVSLIQLLFKKGYFAEQIPYEKYLKESGSDETLAYLSPSMILNKNDVKNLVNMVVDVMVVNSETSDDETYKTLTMVSAMMPYIDNLTLLSDSASSECDPVFARLYQFILSVYMKNITTTELTALEEEGSVENPYTLEKYQDISWTKEIKSLVDGVGDIIELFKNVYVKDSSIIEGLFRVFDEDNENYETNYALYSDIKTKVSDSFLLGDILASEYGTEFLTGTLKNITPNLVLPEINYSNTKDSEGNVTYGEFYYLLSAFEAFCENQNNLDLITKLSSGGDINMIDLAADLCSALTKEAKDGDTVLSDVLSSKLFTSVFSEYMCTADFGDSFEIYIDSSLLVEGEHNQIEKEELEKFFNAGVTVLNIVKNIDTDDMNAFVSSIFTEDVYNTLDSKIIEGTLSKNLIKIADSADVIIIPISLKNGEGLISTDEDTSEVKKLLSLFNLEGLDVSVFTKTYDTTDEQTDAVIGMLKEMEEISIHKMLESKILYYSMSNYLSNHKDDMLGEGADLILPSCILESNDTLSSAIKKDEMESLLIKMTDLLPATIVNLDLSKVLNTAMNEADSMTSDIILSATIANMMMNASSIKDSVNSALTIPSDLKTAVDSEEKLASYTTSNPWYTEEPALLKGLKAALGSITDMDTISDTMTDSIKTLNEEYKGSTRLSYMYESRILSLTITDKIDGFEIMDEADALSIKIDSIYMESEIASLIDLVNILALDLKSSNITSDSMKTSVLTGLLEDDGTGNTKLHDQYENGKITGFIMTKGVKSSSLEIPSDALEDSQTYIKEREAESLIEALRTLGLEDASSVNPDTITLGLVKEVLYDDADAVKSYILFKKVSDTICDNSSLIIPQNAYNSVMSRITDTDMCDFLDASIALLSEDKTVSEVDGISDTVLPTDTTKLKMIADSLIADAIITSRLDVSIDSNPKNTYCLNDEAYMVISTDIYGNSIAVASKTEAYNLFIGVNMITGGSPVNDIQFTVEDLKHISDRSPLYASSILKNLISDAMMTSYKALYSDTIDTYTVIDTKAVSLVNDYESLSEIQMEKFLNN